MSVAGRACAAGGGAGDTAMVVAGALIIGVVVGLTGALVLRGKSAERERAALRRALASSSDWWWRTGPDLRVLEAEVCRGHPTGLNLDALRDRAPWQLDAKSRPEPPPQVAEAVARRLPFHDVELAVALPGVQAKAVRISGAPLYTSTGKFCGYAGVASLLADRPHADVGAASFVRELDSFAYSVSHDLRAPLRVIDGFTQIVLEDYGDRLDSLGREHLKRIEAAGSRMNSMIDTLLTMSRMTGRELQFERVDLSETARQLAEEFKAASPGRTIEVSVEPGLSAEGDHTLMRMVLQNLLGNAFKFSAHTRDARIQFGRRPDGDHAFFVRDNGAGFDMRFADRLFGVFQRLHSQSEFAGTGVGLATVHRIVRRHYGRIWAESEPGKGATFFFTMWENAAPPAG